MGGSDARSERYDEAANERRHAEPLRMTRCGPRKTVVATAVLGMRCHSHPEACRCRVALYLSGLFVSRCDGERVYDGVVVPLRLQCSFFHAAHGDCRPACRHATSFHRIFDVTCRIFSASKPLVWTPRSLPSSPGATRRCGKFYHHPRGSELRRTHNAHRHVVPPVGAVRHPEPQMLL